MFGIGLLFRGEQTLGLGNVYVPRKKEWVQAVIGAALGVGSAIFGGIKSAKAQKEAEALQKQGYQSKIAYLTKARNYDPLREKLYADQKRVSQQKLNASRGSDALNGTNKAALTQESNNEREASVISNHDSTMQTHQLQYDSAIANAKSDMKNTEATNLMNRSNKIAKAASDAGNAVGNAISAINTGSSRANALKASDDANTSMQMDSQATLKNGNNIELNQAEKASGLGGFNEDEERKKRVASVMKDYGWS